MKTNEQWRMNEQRIFLNISDRIQYWKLMHPKIYRSYSYVIFGPEKVGKTNIITRFTKDEFTEIHNLTLENQQTAILTLDGRTFEVNLFDTAGQESMMSMKAVWRHNKDGFIFTFAINNAESYESVINEIKELKYKPMHNNVAMILVGNKIDLQHERKVPKRTAAADSAALGVKYFEVSAKTSSKDDIDALIYELIEINEMERYHVSGENKKALENWFHCDSAPCSLI